MNRFLPRRSSRAETDRAKAAAAAKPSHRSFDRLDAILLLAATLHGSVGAHLALRQATQHDWSSFWVAFLYRRREDSGLSELWTFLLFYQYLLLAWTVAVFWARLKKPRPPWRRLTCQPGFQATAAMLATFAVWFIGFTAIMGPCRLYEEARWNEPMGILEWISWLATRWPNYTDRGFNPAVPILMIWLVSWCGGSWKAEPSWSDRAGRMLGAAWITLSAINLACCYFVMG